MSHIENRGRDGERDQALEGADYVDVVEPASPGRNPPSRES